jgi:hypothetical protein
MRYVLAVASLATLVTPGYAQFNQGGQKTPLQLQYERQEQEQRENERQYEDQMKRLKAQAPAAASNDPWRKVRPATDAAGKK